MEAGMMKNMAEIFLMRAKFSNKLILYTLRRIVRNELSRRIVRAELSCAELSCAELSGHRCKVVTRFECGLFCLIPNEDLYCPE